jgi:hypothetical protein
VTRCFNDYRVHIGVPRNQVNLKHLLSTLIKICVWLTIPSANISLHPRFGTLEPYSYSYSCPYLRTHPSLLTACCCSTIYLFDRYVFGGSSQLITSIFIKQLRNLDDKRINRKGVSKISRNLMALQQNLTNIIVSQVVTTFPSTHHTRILWYDKYFLMPS